MKLDEYTPQELRSADFVAASYEPDQNPFLARWNLVRALTSDFGIEVEPTEIAYEALWRGTPSAKYEELVRLANASKTKPTGIKLLAYLAALARCGAVSPSCGHA